jgi:large subunit ribosomal protein L23
MNAERIHQIILAPIISEKATRLAEKANQAAFKVATDAEKSEIKTAVETLFGVKVTDVHTLNVKGKSKRFGQRIGRRSDWKKAYVTLEAGQQIDFVGDAN